jgi:hypothetical protein
VLTPFLFLTHEDKREAYLAENEKLVFTSPIDMAGNLFHTLFFAAEKDARLFLYRVFSPANKEAVLAIPMDPASSKLVQDLAKTMAGKKGSTHG